MKCFVEEVKLFHVEHFLLMKTGNPPVGLSKNCLFGQKQSTGLFLRVTRSEREGDALCGGQRGLCPSTPQAGLSLTSYAELLVIEKIIINKNREIFISLLNDYMIYFFGMIFSSPPIYGLNTSGMFTEPSSQR